MGGTGSGTWYRCNKKTYVDDCRCLDIARMVKLGAIPKSGWRSGSWIWKDAQTGEQKSSIGYETDTRDEANPFIRVHYTFTESQKKIDYKVRLSRSAGHYGGERFWFICPVKGVRVSKLYLPSGGDIFASRQAYGLSYASQSESAAHRVLRAKWKIVHRTGGDDYPVRTKGMHQKTYEQLLDRFDELDRLSILYLAERLGVWAAY